MPSRQRSLATLVQGGKALSQIPPTWSSFEVARAKLKDCDGIGYVFGSYDGLCGIDFDGCRDPATGELSAWAKPWIDSLESYSEVSPSGSGVKTWVQARSPLSSGKKAAVEGPPINGKSPAVEVYDHGRYFCVTGRILDGVPGSLRSDKHQLETLCQHFWPAVSTAASASSIVEISDKDRTPETPSPINIIERARKYIAPIQRVRTRRPQHDLSSGLHLDCERNHSCSIRSDGFVP